MVLSAGVAFLVAVAGIGLSLWTGLALRFEERVAIGVVMGVLAVSAVTLVTFLVIGMGVATLAIGVGLPLALAARAWRRAPGVVRGEARSWWTRLRRPWRDRTSARPGAAIAVAAGAVTTRVLALSYQTTSEGISAGSLAVWGDWSAHLAYAGSFAYGDNRGLDLPIAHGQPFRYHFLADFFGSIFTVSGATLEQSMVLSAWMLAAVLPILLFQVAFRLTRSNAVSAITVLLFTLTGGVGVWYFLTDVRDGGWRIASALPQTYARMPQHDLWLDNTISASLYAQRSTLMGLCAGAAALVLLLVARPSWSRAGFVAAGALVGITGIAHVHLLVTALALGAFAWIVDRRATWWWFLGPAILIGAPLAIAIRPPTSRMRWLVGWMAPGADEPWVWFWIRNAGILLPAFLVIVLLGIAPAALRRLTLPLWLWFIVPNLVAFHPSEWNNTKFFLFWQLAGCLLIAASMRRGWDWSRRRRVLVRAAVRIGVVMCFAALVVTGSLDTVRAMQRSSAIPWVDRDEVAAALWLRDAATDDDVIVYGASNTSAVAALSGVPALSGYGGWTDDLGLPDWALRLMATRTILTGGAGTEEAIDQYDITYVVIGPRERYEYDASDAYWTSHGTVVFDRGMYRIYSV